MLTTHRRRKPSFKVPNRLVLDGALSFSARRMGAVLYSRRNHLGSCRRSLASLAKSASCSVATARKALEELENAGFITRSRNYKYSELQGRLVYDQYTYHCNLRLHRDFTLVPWDLFGHPLKSSAFVLCLYLYLQAGNGTRAYPSLNRMCRDLWMGKNTVCRALRALEALGRVFSQFCKKTNQAFCNNSYFFLRNAVCCPVTETIAQVVPGKMRRVPILLPFSLHAYKRKMMISRIGAVPFPCLNYKIKWQRHQVNLSFGGSIKNSKLLSRLR